MNITDIGNNASVNNITITCNAADEFNGGVAAFVINQNKGTAQIKPTASNIWNILQSGSGGGGISGVIYADTYNDLITLYPTGNPNILYITRDFGKEYFWNGSNYTQLLGQLDGLFDGKLLLTDKLVSNSPVFVNTSDQSLLYIVISGQDVVTGLSLPLLTSLTGVTPPYTNILNSNPNIASISLPLLQNSAGQIIIDNSPLLTTIDLQSLQTITAPVSTNGVYLFTSASLAIKQNNLLTSINLNSLQSIPNGSVMIAGNPALNQPINLPAYTTGGLTLDTLPLVPSISLPVYTSSAANNNQIRIASMPLITSLSFPAFTGTSGSNVNIVVAGMINMISLSMPVFASKTGSGIININGNQSLTSFSLPVFVSTTGFFGISYNLSLTSISLPALTTVGSFNFSGNDISTLTVPLLATSTQDAECFVEASPNLTSISFPLLASIGTGNTGLNINQNPVLTSISHPNLSYCPFYYCQDNSILPTLDLSMLNAVNRGLFIQRNPLLTTLSISHFTDIEQIAINDNTSLPSVNLASLVNVLTFGQLNIYGNTSCTTINFPSLVVNNFDTWILSDNALTQANVDAILALFASSGAINGTLNLGNNQGYSANVGTNASPTGGVTNADYLTLQANGWTVIIEP